MFLTVAAVAVAAVSARAQALQAPAGYAYTIANVTAATAVNTITYQWYRNNVPIPGATELSYTVPGAFAYGENVQFKRVAKTMECLGEAEKSSNVITITFEGYTVPPGGCNLIIGGVCWADYNIDAPQTFATRADMNTKFYQWNKLTAYSSADPIDPAWNATADNSETWTVNPCPLNWRLPSQEECQQLVSAGSTWAETTSGRGNLIVGRFFGYNHTSCKLPSNMYGCVFLPAAGYRYSPDGGAFYQNHTNGLFWTSTQANATNGYYLSFFSTNAIISNFLRANALTIRCVR